MATTINPSRIHRIQERSSWALAKLMHSRGVSALMMISLTSLESKDGGIIASI
jgi:hypothetical protein